MYDINQIDTSPYCEGDSVMLIKVEGGLFIWRSSNRQAPQVALILYPPIYCVHEKIRIVRGGVTLDEGIANWVGTHGAGPRFEGFTKYLSKTRYNSEFKVGQFREGDELHIELGNRFSESSYWEELTLGKGVDKI